MNSTQGDGIKRRSFWTGQKNGLIAAHTSSAIVPMGIATAKAQIAFGANDKESERRLQAIKPLEVEEATVHDDERAGFWIEFVEEIDLVDIAGRNGDKYGNSAVNLQQCM